MTTMFEGRLSWHQRRRGGWYCYSIDDQYCYTAKRAEGGGWNAEVVRRAGVRHTNLGWYRYLKDAKRAIDVHHHETMLADEFVSDDTKRYLRRYPIEVEV